MDTRCTECELSTSNVQGTTDLCRGAEDTQNIPELLRVDMKTKTHLSTSDAAESLQLLAETAAEREGDLKRYEITPDLSDTGEEADSDCPIFDSFYFAGGSQSIIQMKNFDVREFSTIWDRIKDIFVRRLAVANLRTSPRTCYS